MVLSVSFRLHFLGVISLRAMEAIIHAQDRTQFDFSIVNPISFDLAADAHNPNARCLCRTRRSR